MKNKVLFCGFVLVGLMNAPLVCVGDDSARQKFPYLKGESSPETVKILFDYFLNGEQKYADAGDGESRRWVKTAKDGNTSGFRYPDGFSLLSQYNLPADEVDYHDSKGSFREMDDYTDCRFTSRDGELKRSCITVVRFEDLVNIDELESNLPEDFDFDFSEMDANVKTPDKETFYQ